MMPPRGIVRLVYNLIDAYKYAADDDPVGEYALGFLFVLIDMTVALGVLWLGWVTLV